MITSDDLVTCAEYANNQGLLDTPGWKQFRRIVKSNKKQQLIVNKAKIGKFKREPFWKFGFLIPHVHSQAMEWDEKNKNKRWKEAEDTEQNQLLEYQTFIDKGIGGEAPPGYKKIRCHIIYDVKHDG
jgi:hypothetical protein